MPTWINQVTPWAAGARSCSDTDPYVRKTATMCVAKLYDINPELVEDQAVVIDEDFKILRRYLYKHIERKVIEQFVMWDGIYIYNIYYIHIHIYIYIIYIYTHTYYTIYMHM